MWLSSLEQEPRERITDLQLPVEHHVIVAALPAQVRLVLSEGAMEVFRSKHHIFPPKGLQQLQTEIEEGKCDLAVDASGQILRVVSVAALCLQREDGAVLARIGKYEEGVLTPNCALPGTKVQADEHTKMAIKRLISQKLGDLVESIHLGSHSLDVEESVSKTMGVPSKYMRALFQADLSDHDSACFKVLKRTRNNSFSKVVPGFQAADPTRAYDAFVFRRDLATSGPFFVLAWLSPEDFDLLSSSAGEAFLQTWTSELLVRSSGGQEETAPVEEKVAAVAAPPPPSLRRCAL